MRPNYYSFDADNPAFDPFNWYNSVGAIGSVCWIAAYLLFLRQGFRDRTYALPLLAICMNFAWETLASFVWPNPVWLWRTFDRAWLGVDALLVYQLLRFGRQEQAIPEVRRAFYVLVPSIYVASVAGEYSFSVSLVDRLGLVTAFVVNIVMSALFITFYFARRADGRGLNLPAAWLKMLGTLGTSIECHVLVRRIDPELASLAFLTYLSTMIFILDLIYVILLHRTRQPSSSSTRAAPALV